MFWASGEGYSLSFDGKVLTIYGKSHKGEYLTEKTIGVGSIHSIEHRANGLLMPGQLSIVHGGGKEAITWRPLQSDLFRPLIGALQKAVAERG